MTVRETEAQRKRGPCHGHTGTLQQFHQHPAQAGFIIQTAGKLIIERGGLSVALAAPGFLLARAPLTSLETFPCFRQSCSFSFSGGQAQSHLLGLRKSSPVCDQNFHVLFNLKLLPSDSSEEEIGVENLSLSAVVLIEHSHLWASRIPKC